MHITKVSALNFKGSTFETLLSPVTIVAGPSFAGKSSRLETLELAWRGGFSGKKPGSLMTAGEVFDAYASGDKMVVHFETDDGKAVTRQWLQGKRSVERTCGVTGFQEDWVGPALAFDPNEFLALSGPERTKFLFRVLPPPDLSAFGVEAITAKLKNLKAEPEHTKEHEQAVNGLVEFVNLNYKAGNIPARCTVQQWLEELVGTVKEKANAAVAAAKRMKETVLGLSELKVMGGTDLAASEHARTLARQALETAQTARASLAERWKAKDAGVKACEATAADYVEPEAGARERLEQKVADLRSATQVPAPTPPQPGQRPNSDEARKALEGAQDLARGVLRDVTAARAEVARLEKAVKAAEHAKTCPTCKQSIEEIQKQVVAGYQKPLKEARAKLVKAEAGIGGADAAVTVADANFKAVEKAVTDFNFKQGSDLQKFHVEQSKWQESANLLRLTESQLQTLKDAAAKAEPARIAREQLPGLQDELAVLAGNGQQVKDIVDKAQAACNDADKAHREAVAQAATVREQAKAREAALLAQCEAWATKELSGILGALLEACVDRSLAPMLDTCNRLCGPVLRGLVALVDGELGIANFSMARLVPLRSCSDGEQLLVSAALRLALATTAPLRLAMIGRFESLDNQVRIELIEHCLKLVATGHLDQVVFIQVGEHVKYDYKQFAQDEAFSVVEVTQ